MPKKVGSVVFVLNCGSSSIKFQVIDPKTETVFLSGLVENVQTDRCMLEWTKGLEKKNKKLSRTEYHDVLEEVAALIQDDKELTKQLVAIGHRVVHGGEAFYESVKIDESVLNQIHACSHLAPLHNPVNALGILLMQEKFPELEQVAVFDTAFHQTLPSYAFMYAIPFQYYEKHEVRRYGFHGTSHRYMVLQVAEKLKKSPEELSLISAHLGNGCSVCAVHEGKSIDTSMGFTPLEGLMMGQRSGDIDPGAVGFLAEKLQVEAQEVVTMLNKMSGLLGVSGVSEDLRLVKKAADEGDELSVLAIEMFCYRLAKYIASYLVPLGLPDAIVFTGGIGENAAFIRARVIEWLEPMGFKLDAKRNHAHGKDSNGKISPDQVSPSLFVIKTNEELMIACDAWALVEER